MDYELIALDLDDTVLNSKKEIPKRVKDAIAMARKQGARIVIASGRLYGSLKPYADELGIADYAISLAGSLIHDASGKIIHGTYIDPEIAWLLMNWAASRGLYFQVYTDDGFSYLRRTHYTDSYEAIGGFKGTEKPDLLQRHDLKVGKIVITCPPKDTPSNRAILNRDFPALVIEMSAPMFLEISARESSKGNALRYLARKFEIPREKVMAIGDSEIDKDMIQWAGLGIAMKNSMPSVLEVADYVTDSSDEDGVAKALDRFIFHSET